MANSKERGDRALVQLAIGAGIGPFVGSMSIVLAPLLVTAFPIEKSQLSQAVFAHAIPFAALQVFSGTISDRFGRRGTLLTGFALFVISSALAAAAPTWEVFLVSRSLQGVANAFTTALILATIGDTTPAGRLGRAIGIFTALNSAGQLAAPLMGGLLGDVTWRLPYAVLAVVSFALTVSYWNWFRRFGSAVTSGQRGNIGRNIRGLLNPRMALLISVSYLISLGLTGPVYLYAIFLKDTWEFSTVLIGWLLAIWGISGIVATRYAGRFADQFGPLRTAALGVLASVVGFAVMANAPNPALWAAAFAVAGAGGGTIYTAINSFPVRAFPTMRGGASSLFQSGKFFAPVTAPLFFNPLYFEVGTRSIFAMQAIGMAMVVIPLWMIERARVLNVEPRHAGTAMSADPAD